MFGSILVSGSLTKLNISHNQIGPEGAKEIAKSLSVTGSLTKVC